MITKWEIISQEARKAVFFYLIKQLVYITFKATLAPTPLPINLTSYSK